MAHPNGELVRRGYEGFTKGDMDTPRELFDLEVISRLDGRVTRKTRA